MELTDGDIAAIAVLLSPERLAALTALTGSTRAAIDLHQQTLSLSSELMVVIATVEIALRNAVCENLSSHFGIAGWLLSPPPSFEWKDSEREKIAQALDSGRRAIYSKMTQAEKSALDVVAFPKGKPVGLSHSGRARHRRGTIPITDGKVIAELTLYFWKRLYGPDYEHGLWRPTLKRTFPDKTISRAQVADHLENVYQSRNRLAHHEPVVRRRFHDVMTSIRFVTRHLLAPEPSAATPLAKLVADDLAAVERKAAALHARMDSFLTSGQ
jgi:hypothetical protein